MPSSKNQPKAWYALRRTLPPWRFEELLAELRECLPAYGVDEVIVKIDTEEFTHGHPTLAWAKDYQKKLFDVKALMDELGIVYSLNPWVTLCHCDRGRDVRKDIPGFGALVGHDGAQCTACACPLSEGWRTYIAELWGLYAETHPHVIWVEDDIRTFNHRPATYTCFCELHLKRFGERVNQTVTREELVAALVREGEPHPWRAEFLEMQGDVMVETVAHLAQAVHRHSPDTCMGLMSSGPRNHAMEGRKWDAFAGALADGKPLYSRPPMGNYSENNLRGFYYSHDSIKITRHCMPPETVEQTEVENVPFTQYSKSEVFTFLETAISFAYGSHGVTMNLFDHCGTPMQDDPGLGRMLAEKKPYLEALAEVCQQTGTYRGVRLLFKQSEGFDKRMRPGARPVQLAGDGGTCMEMLESHGIPTGYEEANVAATCGQTIRSYSDSEIKELLSGGLLLDAVAARILYERGFGEAIGLRSIAPACNLDQLGAFSAEEFIDAEFGGSPQCYLTLTIPGLSGRPDLSVMEPVPEARILSRIVDPDTKPHHPCMVAYENSLGGRVVIQGFDLGTAFGRAFCHPFRAVQLQNVVRWLAMDAPDLLVRGGVYPLAFRKDLSGGDVLLGLFNLSLDDWPRTVFEVSGVGDIKRVEALDPTGAWQPADDDVSARSTEHCLHVEYKRPVSFREPLMLRLSGLT